MTPPTKKMKFHMIGLFAEINFTQNYDEDGSINIVITEEVEIIFWPNLSVSSKTDQDTSDEGKETVADDHEVLDETCATRLHDENTNSGR